MKNSNNDPQKVKFAKTGFFVFIIFLLSIILIKTNQNRLPWKYYTISIHSPNENVLAIGDKVICNNVEIGYIKDINQTIYQTRLKRKFKIPKEDIQLDVLRDSTSNQPYIQVTIGEIKKPYLVSGDLIKIQ